MPFPQSRIPFSVENPYRPVRPATSRIIFLSLEGSVTEEEYFERVSDINNNDYSPLVLSALKEENRTFGKKESYKIEYDSEKLKKDFIEYNNDEIAIVIGEINKKQTFKDGDKIINLQYPFDELFNFIDILKEKQIKITLLFTECNLLNLETVLLLLNKEIEIYLASCSNLLINPHVIQALKNEFKINVIE